MQRHRSQDRDPVGEPAWAGDEPPGPGPGAVPGPRAGRDRPGWRAAGGPAAVDYRSLAEGSPDALSLTRAGVIEWFSPAIEDLTGYRPADLVGERLADHLHPDDRAAGPDPPPRARLRLGHRDGSWRWVEVRARPMPDDRPGRPTVAAWRPVDEQLAHLQELSEREAASRRRAEQLQRALDSRIVIEQAKGILAGERGITVDAAFELLRSHARRRGARLQRVAEAVVSLGLRP